MTIHLYAWAASLIISLTTGLGKTRTAVVTANRGTNPRFINKPLITPNRIGQPTECGLCAFLKLLNWFIVPKSKSHAFRICKSLVQYK